MTWREKKMEGRKDRKRGIEGEVMKYKQNREEGKMQRTIMKKK